jgi:alpha-amylase
MMYELDARSICHNLLATLTRREEAYHYKVRAGEGSEHVDATGIHDRVVFKQHGLDERLSYDRHPRKSLIDHFYPLDATIGAVAAGAYDEVGDFVDGTYEAKLRRAADRMQVQLFREGYADERTIRITKGVTLEAGDDTLEIAYLLEGLTPGERLHFGIEFNFAGMPAGADDRYFRDGEGNVLGQLGTMLDLVDVDALGLTDGWLGIDVDLKIDRPSCLWTFPIETVSQSEGGFELVHQSVVVQPHWFVEADAEGRWSVQIRLSIGTPAADQARRSTERIGVGV